MFTFHTRFSRLTFTTDLMKNNKMNEDILPSFPNHNYNLLIFDLAELFLSFISLPFSILISHLIFSLFLLWNIPPKCNWSCSISFPILSFISKVKTNFQTNGKWLKCNFYGLISMSRKIKSMSNVNARAKVERKWDSCPRIAMRRYSAPAQRLIGPQ